MSSAVNHPVGAKISSAMCVLQLIGHCRNARKTGWSNANDRVNFVSFAVPLLRRRLVGGRYLVRNHVNQYRIIGEKTSRCSTGLRKISGCDPAAFAGLSWRLMAPTSGVLHFSAIDRQYAETHATLSLY